MKKRLLGQAQCLYNGGDRASDERKLPGQSNRLERFITVRSSFKTAICSHQPKESIQNSKLSHQPQESKFVQQLGKRARKGRQKSSSLRSSLITDAKSDEGMVRPVATAPGYWVEGKEKNKRDDDRTVDGQGFWDET
ncbi:hypothetical protein NC653_037784 [Populus alba x Populus x berolinensis]|uniref:Uncharacterized protein n=1 Tax=Populus alba x Populus x berolinensis TaxID=444605 RepID=A0AAD6LF12_9ROSI|nr:hypothetical protein NC653_037784 [Populus alba x Populus x berolinensis]